MRGNKLESVMMACPSGPKAVAVFPMMGTGVEAFIWPQASQMQTAVQHYPRIDVSAGFRAPRCRRLRKVYETDEDRGPDDVGHINRPGILCGFPGFWSGISGIQLRC